MMGQHYLGDGLYVKWEGPDLVLYTSNGIEVTNTVVLEPSVLKALMAFLDSI
jgi:hypothetical protein